MGNKNTIELNGKMYDAFSGQLLGAATIPHRIQRPATQPAKGHRGRTIDVFAPVKPATAPKRTAIVHDAQKATAKPARMPAKPVHHHPAQSSQTLMRSSVHKPGASFKRQITVQYELAKPGSTSLIVAKTSVNTISPHRLERAKTVARSSHISHYHQPLAIGLRPSVIPLAVQPAPQPDVAAPKPQPDNKPPAKPADLFEQAIANANHYVDLAASKVHFKKRARRHVLSMAAGTLALVILGGFVAYQHIPGAQIKIAALQAGVHTAVPNFRSAGFAYRGAHAGDAQLTIGFTDASGHNYQLIQQKTNWSASDMIDNLASTDASGTPDYTTLQAGHNTVYRFANNSVTWVANGQWYQLNGTGNLSNAQVKSIVTSV